MSDPNQPPSADDLGNRITKARRAAGLERSDETDADRAVGSGLGVAWRISIELVVAVVVCTAIGYGLDRIFETRPWAMLVMMFLGAGAGMSNAVRTALRVDREAMDAMDRKRGRQQTGAKRERGD